MKRFYVLGLWFMLGLSVDFCYAGKGVKRSKPDSSDSIATEEFSPKQSKAQAIVDLWYCKEFTSHDEMYIRMADEFSDIKDLKVRFTKLVELFNVTDYFRYKKASNYIYILIKGIIFNCSTQECFSLLYGYVDSLCPDSILSQETYENKAWGLLMVCKLLKRVTNFDDQQKEQIDKLTQSLYTQALAYKRTLLL